MSALTPDGWDDLVQKTERQLADLDPLGPRLDDGKVFGRAEKALFRDGLRVAVVDGHEINWRPYRTLFTELRALLLPAVDGSNPAAQLTEMYREAKRSPYDLEHVNSLKPGLRLIDPAWLRAMKDDCNKVDALVLAAGQRALDEGRVIVLGEGGLLIAPTRVRAVKPRFRELFLFSKDLPQARLVSGGQKRQKAKTAGEAFILIVAHFHSEGRRVTKEQLLEIAEQEFKLTRGGAEAAYNKVKNTLAMKSGKPRVSEKVVYNEIIDLLIMEEVISSSLNR